jgi:heterodisulfide reductase subunit A-like polyferredoxin
MASTETQSILVVCGGMRGLTAAIEAAVAGYER